MPPTISKEGSLEALMLGEKLCAFLITALASCASLTMACRIKAYFSGCSIESAASKHVAIKTRLALNAETKADSLSGQSAV